MKSRWLFFSFAILAALSLALPGVAGEHAEHKRPPGTSANMAQQQVIPAGAQVRVVQSSARPPLSFEMNKGQIDPQVKFLSRGQGSALFLTGNEVVIRLGSSQSSVVSGQFQKAADNEPQTTDVVRVKLQGSNPGVEVMGENELPRKSNYFIGSDPKKWQSNVPNYTKVRFREIYPGVDLVFYGDEKRLEFDFVVAPGADPNQIELQLEIGNRTLETRPGASGHRVLVTKKGDLLIETAVGVLRFAKPVVYQTESTVDSSQLTAGRRVAALTTDNVDWPRSSDFGPRTFVEGRYVLLAGNRVKFQLGSYDPAKSLVIDPSLSQSWFLGSAGTDVGNGIALKSSQGWPYVTGWTDSAAFPTTTTKGVYQGTSGGGKDAFVAYCAGYYYVTCVDGWVTYLGGSGDDFGNGVAVDLAGNVYVTGSTTSGDFPVHGTASPYQANSSGGLDAFVTVLNSSGSGLIYSTYLGGSGTDSGQGILTDGTGASYLIGTTTSTDLPATSGAIQTSAGGGTCGTNPCHDAFFAKIGSTGSTLDYLTYLGGSGEDFGNGLAFDGSLNIYLVGSTTSSDLAATSGAYQATLGGTQNAFVAKLSPLGATPPTLLYLSYLGGSGTDSGNAIAVDALGNAYITGSTSSANFPVFPNPGIFQTALNGQQNAFVAKLNPLLSGASSLVYSTYLGGNGVDSGNAIVVNSLGDAHVVGGTTSTNFPTALPTQPASGGGEDAFVAKLDTSGAVTIFSTYLGGSMADAAKGAAWDSGGGLWLVGTTGSNTFPTNWGGPYKGGSDAFITLYTGVVIPILTVLPTTLTLPDTIKGSTSSPLSVTLTNYGDTYLSISSVTINGDFSIQTNGCGSTLAANSSCLISVVFSPSTTGTRTGTLTIKDNSNGCGSNDCATQTVSLSGRGVSAGVPTFNPTSLTFDPLPVGTPSAAQAVTLTNTGTGAMVISSITTDLPFAQTNNCPLTPAALAAGAHCTINVTFTPTAAGMAGGQLRVVDDAAGSPHSVTLSGTGLAPVVSLSPTSLVFGNVAVGQTSASQDVTLSNTGTLDLTITNIVASAGFRQTNTCPVPGTLAVGSNCTITVTFSPTSVGTAEGTISISDSALDSPQSVTLSGTGTGVGVSLTPPNLTFSDQTVGVQSAGQQITLANTGNATLTLSIAISGLFPGDFRETDDCAGSVSGPGTCTIKVFFTPSAAQSESATLVITDNAPGSPHVVNLTGTGLPASTAPSQAYTMTRGDYGTGAAPSSMVGDDFNNDGRPDLVVANRAGASISILLGAPNGTLLPHIDVPTGNQPAYVVGGYFDADINRDLAVANFADNKVSILLGKGNGTFQPQTTYDTGKGPVWIATADFNRDNHTDLAIVNSTDGTVTILLGKGDGTFLTPLTALAGPNPTSAAVGDFNGDWRTDLAVTNSGNNTVSILLGQDDGTFVPTATPLATGADPVAVAAGDFSKDNWPDLVVANFKDKTLSVFLNSRSGGSFAPPTPLLVGDGPTSVKVGDFNGDGNLDIGVTYSSCGKATLQTPCFAPGFAAIFFGKGDGTFPLLPVTYALGSGVAALGTDDFNSDGIMDVVAANSSDNTVTVLMGQQQGLYSVRADLANGSVTNATAVVMADFDKNGIQDIAVANHDMSSVSIFLGNADGTFKPPVAYSTGAGPSALVVADFNRDSNPDLGVANTTDGTASVLLGDGKGAFPTARTSRTGAGPVALVAGDFNKDNNPDLVTADFKDNTISILKGKGDGTFQTPATITVGVGPDSLATGDFNKDGNLDLAVANQGSNNLLVLLGKGDGTFQNPVAYTTGPQPSFVAAADVNGDGYLDLVEANPGDGTASVLIGVGNGTFKVRTSYATATHPASVTVGDFNGDNIVDLAVAAQVPGCASGAGDVSVLLGAGGGQFHARMDYATASCPTAVTAGNIGTNFPRSLVVSNWNGTVSAFQNRPVAALSQSSIVFPQIYVNQSSDPTSVTLSNPSGAPLSLTGFTQSGPFFQSNNCPTTPNALGPGVTCSISVAFHPMASGAATGNVTISSNLQGGNQVITLSGTGTTANLSLSPSSLDFGNQAVGFYSSPLTLTVTSTGTSNLIFNDYPKISGTNAADFSLYNYSCSYYTNVAPGNTCTVQVRFKPALEATETASLVLKDNGPLSPQIIPLSGTGVPPSPAVTLNPTSLSFGEVNIGTSSYSRYVRVQNSGTADLIISSVSITGTNASDFVNNSDYCSGKTVTHGSSCDIYVIFKPSIAGSESATLSIPDNAADSPQTVALEGTGVGVAVTLNPVSLSFGSVNVGTTSAPQSVSVKNSGTADLTVSSVSIIGTNASDFAKSSDTCSSATVTPGNTCSISVTFKPSASGSESATLSIADNASNSPQTVALSGTGVAPAVTLDPSSLSFGSVSVGTTSAAQSVTVTNSGTADLTVSSVTITGTNAADFAKSADACSGTTVTPGKSCSISVTFKPSATGSESATVSIADDASGSPHTVALSGTGTAAAVTLSANSLSYGSVKVGTTSAAQSVTVTNSGTADLTVASVSISGTNASDFSKSSDTCSSATVTPGNSCSVGVTFKPSLSGAESATLKITSNASGSPHSVSLSGTGVAPAVTLSANSLSFGSVNVGTTSAAQSVSVTNSGTADLIVASVSISGTNAADFVKSADTCSSATVTPGKSCDISLTFKPSAAGSRSATLNITDNALGSPQTLALNGTGTTVTVLLTPSSLSFGSVSVGTTSAAQSVSVKNSGTADLTVSSVSISGTNASDFSKSSDTCSSAAVTPGNSCSVGITFKPSLSGAESATLKITSNASGSPHSVSLSGTGVAPAVSLSPTSLTFDNQLVGTASPARTVTLKNTGTGSLSISAITIGGTHAEDFALHTSSTCKAGSPVAAGGSCTLNVTFTPLATGTHSAALNITSNAGGSPHSVSLSGTGINTPAGTGVSVEPSDTATGTSPVTVTFSSVSASGTTSLNTGTSCPGPPSGYGPGNPAVCYNLSTTATYSGAITVTIDFTGVSYGSPSNVRLYHYESGAWVNRTVTVNAAAHTVTGSVATLSAFAVLGPPVASPSVASLNFNDQGVSTTSSAKPITVTNSGNAPLAFTSITPSGDFKETDNCLTGSVAVGGTCTIQVSFTPTATGSRSGSLTLKTNGAGSPQSVALSGNGVVAYSLSPSSASASVIKGTDSTTFTISAATPFGFTGSIALACSGAGAASCTFDPTSISPGASSTLTVGGLNAVTGNTLNFSVTGTSGAQTASLPLTVSIADFSVSSSPTSATITAGQTASYTLSLTPLGGFNQAVKLACTGAPQASTCSPGQNSVTLNGTSATQVTVSVKTTARSMAWRRPGAPPLSKLLPRPPAAPAWFLGLLTLLVLAWLGGAWRWRRELAIASLMLIALTWAACGGGVPPPPSPSGTPAGTYSLTVTGTYTGTSASLSRDIKLTLTVN